jgi:hypothetical protein
MSDTGLTAPAAGAPPAAESWFKDIAGEDLGYIQNRGLDKLSAKDAILATAKAHREAERLIGAPANEVLRMPKDAADAEGWTRVRDRLGVPADAKDYDFSTVKVGENAIDPKIVDALRPALQAANVSKDRAPDVMKAVASVLAARDTEGSTAAAERLAAERETLKINWGSNAAANMITAQAGAKALGLEPEIIGALEKTAGYAKTMEAMRNIGARIGEPTFISNQAPGSTGVMSAEQAVATLAERKSDAAWTTKLMAGDTTTRAEFNNLTRVISAAKTAAGGH